MKEAAGYLLPPPVPGTPVSGDPVTPGPPDAPVLGAVPEVPDELAPEPAPPGIPPTPGDPDVAVPTDFGRDMVAPPVDPGRSPLFSALPLDEVELPVGAGLVVSDGMAP